MKLTSDFVGAALKEYICQISARRIMNYAAAIGDANPLYFNDERPEGIIAPPLFPVAVTWPIMENIADYLEADGFPKEILFTQVHYSEHLHIHRPVKPGSDLKIRGPLPPSCRTGQEPMSSYGLMRRMPTGNPCLQNISAP